MSPTSAETPPKNHGLYRLVWPSLAIAGGLGIFELLRNRLQQSQVFRRGREQPSPFPGFWRPLPLEDVFFPSQGVLLHGWWLRRERPRATIVYCHGRSGTIEHRKTFFRHLFRLGFNVFAFDYRGYGRSGGQPSERGLFADARAALDTVTTQLEVDPSGLVLFGHSLGGAVAIDAALDRPVAGLVVESSFTNLRDAARQLSRLPLHLLTRNAFHNIEKVPRLQMPKLFIHGTADTTIPFVLGERLFQAAAEPKQWYAVPNADHEDLHRHDRRRYFRTLAEFSARCRGPALP